MQINVLQKLNSLFMIFHLLGNAIKADSSILRVMTQYTKHMFQ